MNDNSAKITLPAEYLLVAARYFDGKSSRPFHVLLSVHEQTARLTGDIERECPLARLRVSERFSHAGRKVTFPDGAYLEVAPEDCGRFNALLDATSFLESPVVRAQHRWRAVGGALIAIVVLLAATYLYVLPAAARQIAHAIPDALASRIGTSVLALLDGSVLQPSKLPPARQQALVARFNALAPPDQSQPFPPHRILFRSGLSMPNAFTLPSGDIVLTDALVTLLADEDAIMGVLAHEVGHIQQKHLLQQLVQSSAIGVAATLLLGDVSILATNVSVQLLSARYSREAEREADDYAVAVLKANGIALSKLAYVFEKLQSAAGPAGESPSYLSTHPGSSERIARIKDSGQ